MKRLVPTIMLLALAFPTVAQGQGPTDPPGRGRGEWLRPRDGGPAAQWRFDRPARRVERMDVRGDWRGAQRRQLRDPSECPREERPGCGDPQEIRQHKWCGREPGAAVPLPGRGDWAGGGRAFDRWMPGCRCCAGRSGRGAGWHRPGW